MITSTTTYYDFQDLGIPHGVIVGNPIYIAQDEHTRQYHTVDAHTFVCLCNGSWEQDEVMSVSYSGNLALIDPATQVVCHIYDGIKTPSDELHVFDRLIADEMVKLIEKKRGKKP
jgi:hypothetical protein